MTNSKKQKDLKQYEKKAIDIITKMTEMLEFIWKNLKASMIKKKKKSSTSTCENNWRKWKKMEEKFRRNRKSQ